MDVLEVVFFRVMSSGGVGVYGGAGGIGSVGGGK